MRVHSPRTTSGLVTSFSYVLREHWRNLFGAHRRQVKNGAVCAVCMEKPDINPVDFPPATLLQLCFLLNQNDLWRRRIRHHSPNFLKTSLIPLNSVPAALELLSQSCLLTPGRLYSEPGNLLQEGMALLSPHTAAIHGFCLLTV